MKTKRLQYHIDLSVEMFIVCEVGGIFEQMQSPKISKFWLWDSGGRSGLSLVEDLDFPYKYVTVCA